MPTPILAAKLYIPHTRPNLVPHACLIKRLNEGLCLEGTPGVTLIYAPTGCGKTIVVTDRSNQKAKRGTMNDESYKVPAPHSSFRGDKV